MLRFYGRYIYPVVSVKNAFTAELLDVLLCVT